MGTDPPMLLGILQGHGAVWGKLESGFNWGTEPVLTFFTCVLVAVDFEKFFSVFSGAKNEIFFKAFPPLSMHEKVC